MAPELKLAFQARIKERLGITVSGLSGLYVYFVLLAHDVLAEGAVASWLLPSEFLYVNYGKALRDYLQHRVTLLDIYQFQADEVQFDDALVSSCVVTYAKRVPGSGASFHFSVGADLEHPVRNEAVSLENEGLSGKWTLHNFGAQDRQVAPDAARLGELFNIKRGMATGANDFFIVDKGTVERYAIPAVFLKPVLPSPRYVTETVIHADDQGNPRIERFDFLVDCDLPPEVVKQNYPGLWEYLQVGVAEGIPERYLCGSRDAWYYQEKRPPSPYLVTYMGRSNGETQSPFRFILNLSRAVVTNVYLNLYPVEHVAHRLCESEGRYFELLELLKGIPLLDVVRAGRAYGGGLHKIEPKELAQLVLPGAPEWLRPVAQKQLALL